jgi:hypothetical protein
MQRRGYDARRRDEQPWRAWYKLPLWQSIRAAQLRRQPLCERCLEEKRIEPATVCNHRVAHRGDWPTFIAGPFESLCKSHHDREAQAEERRATARPRGA